MVKIRRSAHTTACRILNENDVCPLINFFWIMIAFSLLFVFLVSEVSANSGTYCSKYTLSLRGVHFSTEKSEYSEVRRDTERSRSTTANYTEEEMPNLREAYEKFEKLGIKREV